MSQSGIFYKLIVTCLLLGVTSSVAGSYLDFFEDADTPLFEIVPRRASPGPLGGSLRRGGSRELVSSASFEDGAYAASPDRHLSRQRDRTMQYVRRNQRQVFPVDGYETAAQTYIIEPVTQPTTTKPRTFKKRKTRRPITVLAEKERNKKAEAEGDNREGNSEVHQGGPPPFNPFQQIVNTKFGKKRPSDNKPDQAGRPRQRPRGRQQGVDNQAPPNDSLNEIPSTSTEGEPRAVGRRRPAPDVRPIGQTSSNDNEEQPHQPGRFAPRKKIPRPVPSDVALPGPYAGTTFGDRPRTFQKPKPAPFSDDVPESPRGNDEETQQKARPAPVRSFGGSRFSSGNNNAGHAGSRDSDATPAPALPPKPAPIIRRRPSRPAPPPGPLPESVDKFSNAAPTKEPESISPGDELTVLPPFRGAKQKQGFTLRPKPPTPVSPPEPRGNSAGQPAHREVVVTSKPINNNNRRRKRPLATAAPVVSYNKERAGHDGNNDRNVENVPVPRRVPTVIRPRPAQISHARPIHEDKEEEDEERPSSPPAREFPESPIRGPSHGGKGPIRNVAGFLNIGPIHDSRPDSIFDLNFANPGLVSPETLAQDPGLEKVLGVPGNFNNRATHQQFRPNIPQSPLNHSPPFRHNPLTLDNPFDLNGPFFSQRSTPAFGADIFDANAAASTEKQAVALPPGPAPEDENEQVSSTTTPKPEPRRPLSALERLQNRQAAARRFLTPRKPTEGTTATPVESNKNSGKNARKSLIPPRNLRPRGKLQQESGNEQKDEIVDENAEKPENTEGKDSEIINESPQSGSDTESNVVQTDPKAEEQDQPASSSKPSLVDNAKRRRITLPGRNSQSAQSQHNIKLTQAPPSDHSSDATPPPTCEDGQRYSKFLKRCVTMYKPKSTAQS